MRVQKITTNYQTKNYQTKNNTQSFRGFVNGKYYTDHVISEAKKAMRNPNWQKEIRNEYKEYLKGYVTWHEGIKDQVGATTRALAGILTLGASEVLVAGTAAAAAAANRIGVEKRINEIKDCIIDLLESGQG